MNDDFDSLFDNSTSETDNSMKTPSEQNDPVVSTEIVEETPAETTEPNVETAPAAPTEHGETAREDKSVPLATFLDMRDRMKAAERLADDRQRQWDEYQKSKQTVAAIPDPNIDPIGWANNRFNEFEQQMLDQKIQICGNHAIEKHGAETVSQAASWGQARALADPNFDHAFRQQPDPVAWVISQHRHAVQLDEMQRDPEAFARKIALEKGWLAPVEPVAQASAPTNPTASKTRPTTLTDVPPAIGKMSIQSEQEEFDAMFKR